MDPKQLKVTALMTAPRFEIVYCRNYIEIALRKAGVPLVVSGGVFYGQCMQRMMEDAIEQGIDVALTVDFDSMFTSWDVKRLLSVLASYDHIDSVCPMQVRRGGDTPLMTIQGATQVECNGAPISLDTAHFGLTAIDLHRLKDVPKPWFWSKPDDDGKWTKDKKIDDDIWFWRQWKNAGRTIYCDTDTRIGHMEEMVTTFDAEMNVQHLKPKEWYEQNYPDKKGTLVFVGANCGDRNLDDLYQRFERVILFEPQAEATQHLVHRYPSAEIVCAACDTAAGTKTLNIYNDGLSSSFGTVTQQAVKHYSTFDLSLKGTTDVQTFNLQEWLSAQKVDHVDMMVIDAQGMDFEILKTIEPYLIEGKIDGIQLETDQEGFRHYEGVPDNCTTSVVEWLEQFPHYSAKVPEPHLAQPEVIIQRTGQPCIAQSS